MSRSLMIQGTGSGVGKSLLVTGLCRIFSEMGINVAPFKSQNMALNSYVTKEGGEIGRAQALQAEAAGIEPSVHMNPILLKSADEIGSQVILLGKVHSNMEARAYYEFKDKALQIVMDAWQWLSSRYELIIIEGAGSPAEINLMDKEIVNMTIAKHTGSPVILIGDIDRGGVFASLYGTVALLNADANLIRGFIINKFRGDREILEPGNRMIEKKTGIPVIGVLPYLGDIGLHEEDGTPIEGFRSFNSNVARQSVKVVVIRLKYISNFTDFDPFIYEPDVELFYSIRREDILNADLIIIPGSKNTLKDLLFLRQSGIEQTIKTAVNRGIPLIGICGGYQMLGEKIEDPHKVESKNAEIDGLGFLDINTVFDRTKTTCQVKADMKGSIPYLDGEFNGLKGYEIHMGRTEGTNKIFKVCRLDDNKGLEVYSDGSSKGIVWGTYMHGIFDNDVFRRGLIDGIRTKKGLAPLSNVINYSGLRDEAIDRWADMLRENIDMNYIEDLIK